MTRTTQMIKVGRCITNKFQPKSRGRRGVAGLARNIQVNGQLTPITAVADGDAYQVVYSHRRLAAMKSIGERWIEAYVEDSWADATMARRLNAENSDRAEPTAAARICTGISYSPVDTPNIAGASSKIVIIT